LANADEVYGLLAEMVATRRSEEWIELCLRLGIPVSPVPSLADIVDDPAHHRGVLTEHEHPVAGTYRQIAHPVRFSESGTRTNVHAPLRAQDTDDVLGAAGYTPAEIDALVASGVVQRRAPIDPPLPSTGTPATEVS
jgi:formyl-CoA transferase